MGDVGFFVFISLSILYLEIDILHYIYYKCPNCDRVMTPCDHNSRLHNHICFQNYQCNHCGTVRVKRRLFYFR